MVKIKRMQRTWMLLAAMIVGGFSGVSSAGQLSEMASAQELIKQLKSIKSIHSTFRQWVQDAKQASLQDVTGTMWVQKPGQFRWDTNNPYPQSIIANGEYIWIYDEDLEQATQQKLDKHVGNTPALLLSGDPSMLADSFSISAYLYDDTKEWRFDLKPKGEDSLFELLRVNFKNGKLLDMYLEDALGQTTKIEFSNIALNSAIKQNVFTFDPPANVDIIKDF
ncbi:outer membrane lipoprotein carrier protein LolA [Gammaproteobacteria bacterium 42_54_T18]|nr:outer membrane lipoprotein carrier protein LolA [Gammaproteobacteria bacterium 42_54_T18]